MVSELCSYGTACGLFGWSKEQRWGGKDEELREMKARQLLALEELRLQLKGIRRLNHMMNSEGN